MGLIEVSSRESRIHLRDFKTDDDPSTPQDNTLVSNKQHPSHIHTLDSDESDSIDLTCQEDTPSSPSNVSFLYVDPYDESLILKFRHYSFPSMVYYMQVLRRMEKTMYKDIVIKVVEEITNIIRRWMPQHHKSPNYHPILMHC